MNNENNLPDKVSWRVVDAWCCIPPCNYEQPYCHVQCPYFYECNPPEEDYDEEEGPSTNPSRPTAAPCCLASLGS